MTIKVTYNVTDVYMSQSVSPVYINVSYSDGGTSGGGVWGSITGTLSNQTDLQNALNAKLDESTIDGGTEGQILSKASATDFDFTWINNYAKYLATNVRNQSGSTIGAFQVVYISGATGNKPLISLADADTEATSSKTYGVTATSIANNGTGDVVTAGELSGIDTSAFNEGDLLWLSTTAGGVVTSPPAEPAHGVFIGYVVRSHPTLGTIDVSIQNGYELNELHGVQITTPTDNQGLFYNATSTLWENKSINTALGFTPVPTTRTITINGVTYDLSADRTWTIAAGISGSGASGQVTYWTGASAVSGSNNLFWDAANSRLGIGTNVPASLLHVTGNVGSFNNPLYVENTGNTTNGHKNVAKFVGNRGNSSVIPDNTNIGIWQRSNIVGNYGLVNFYNSDDRDAAFFGVEYVTHSNPATSNFVIATSNNALPTVKAKIFKTGNLVLQNGGTFSDDGQRLQVIGDTLLRGSGATSATTALTVQNSDSTNLFRVRNDGRYFIGGSANAPYIQAATDGNPSNNGTGLIIYNTINATSMNSGALWFTGNAFTHTLGNPAGINIDLNFSPTSGTAQYRAFQIVGTINQTGGANGITRGLYVNPTLTAAADFRAIEWSNNSGWGLYGAGTAWNYLNGNLGIGTVNVTSGLTIWNRDIYLRSDRFIGAGNTEASYGSVWNRILFYNGSNGDMSITLHSTAWWLRHNANISIAGNAMIGTTSDLGVRLGVVGDTILRGSGNTSTTTALTVQNSSSTNLFRVLNNGDINIGGGTQDYIFAKRANLVLTLQSQLTGSLQQTEYYTKDGDGTDDNGFAIFARGIPSDITNFEQFRYFYSASLTSYVIGTNKGGTGVFRDIRIGNSLTPTDLIVKADTGNILVNTTTDVASSRLTINSTTQGFLPPRMTTTQKNAITSPANGLVVFDTTLNKLCVYTTAWETITSI